MDANRYEGSYGLQKILSPRSYIRGDIYYIGERKRHGSDNIYVNFNEYKLHAFYADKLSYRYSMNIFVEMRDRKYKDYSNGFGNTREDRSYKGYATLSVTLLKELRLNTRLGYETVRSNEERFSYQKYTASLSLLKTF